MLIIYFIKYIKIMYKYVLYLLKIVYNNNIGKEGGGTYEGNKKRWKSTRIRN